MRSFKLSSAILALAALVALATAGAAPARAPHKIRTGVPGANCGVSLNVAPRLVTSGETVLAFGQAKCPPAEAAGATVTLYQRVAESPGFAVAGTTTTDAKGFYQM